MMTDSEIKTYYRWLRPQQDRVGIIADLNGCKKEEIRRILGVEEKQKRNQNRKTKWDLDRARELWDLGCSDADIAKDLGNGCVSGNVACWRHNHGLENKGPGKGNRKPKVKFEDALVEAKKADKKKPATINQEWEKAVDEMIAEMPPKRVIATPDPLPTYVEAPPDPALKKIFPSIIEPDAWEIVRQLEQKILFLRGVAIGAGVRNIDELLAECGG